MTDPLDELFDEVAKIDTDEVQDAPEVEADPVAEVKGADDPAPAEVGDPKSIKGEIEAAPPADVDEKNRSIPITALLDEREKRQKAEREAEELRAWRAQMEARQAQSQQKPDFFDNPEAVLQQQEQRFQQMLVQDRVQRSAEMAKQEHGEQFVNEVVEFFNDPKHMAKSHEFLRHPFPMMEAIRYYRQQQALAEIGDDPTSYRERVKAELLAELQAQSPAPVQTQRPATPPRSMASAPAAPGGKSVMPVDPLFD